jgi:two-component system, OmpR family, KDP operon response regulator KdpE
MGRSMVSLLSTGPMSPMTSARPLVLIIEDEPHMRQFLRASLGSHQYRTIEATTGEDGLAQAASHNPDAIMLDLGLPDVDGMEVARRLREWSKAPIIVISARTTEDDKVLALEGGADDYLTKPFGARELVARLRVALRHAASTSEPVLRVGQLRVDLGARQVWMGSERVILTPIEFKLLLVLAKNAGKVVTHRQLLQEVWGPTGHEPQYVRVYMAHLRQKLEANAARPKYLLTEQGVGYRLCMD